MKTYTGRRRFSATTVTVDGRPLRFRRDLRCHSPAEFEWSYGGSGPAQLALAILADHLDNDEEALNLSAFQVGSDCRVAKALLEAHQSGD